MSFNIFFLIANIVLACWNLGQHLLALDGNQEVFDEVFHLLFQDEGSRDKESQKCSPNLESPIHKQSKIDLDCE